MLNIIIVFIFTNRNVITYETYSDFFLYKNLPQKTVYILKICRKFNMECIKQSFMKLYQRKQQQENY